MQSQEPKTNTNTSDKVRKEIEQALNGGPVRFEEIPDETASPLNQPVIDKLQSEDQSIPPVVNEVQQQVKEQLHQPETPKKPEINDAPEQEISGTPNPSGKVPDPSPNVEIPLSHARLAADTFLGVADNALEVGGGFFVTIRKHKEFYEFDEVVEVIEEQNSKNITRLKLDAADKLLLHPLLVTVIQRSTRKLTPEQQLAAAVLSILVKKAKLMIEIRGENELLTGRIRDIIRAEKKEPETVNEPAAQTKQEPLEEQAVAVMEVTE